jgi:hypothetical protein
MRRASAHYGAILRRARDKKWAAEWFGPPMTKRMQNETPESRVWVLATIDLKTNHLSLAISVVCIFPGEKKLHSIDKRQIDFISFAIY